MKIVKPKIKYTEEKSLKECLIDSDFSYSSVADGKGNCFINFNSITNKTSEKKPVSIDVLLFDENKNVLACVHAGWKGTAKKIVQKAISIMENEFLCSINDIKAAIGAAIGQECFGVSSDVADQLDMTIKNNHGKIFINIANKTHVDLKKLNEEQLNEVGIFDVDVCKYCTSCQNSLFYSYRADNRCTGRHGMLAMIKE